MFASIRTEAFKTCKNTIKLINLRAPPLSGVIEYMTPADFYGIQIQKKKKKTDQWPMQYSHLKTYNHLKMPKKGSQHVDKFLMLFKNRKYISFII